jgi:group II intron reverse transcriptase/maturase
MKGGLLVLSDKTNSALTGVSKATLQKGVRIKHLFRIMTHYPDLWMVAYAKIASNDGAMTKGVDDSTLDGMSRDRVMRLINALKDGSYTPQPVRRVYIPKKNGKRRPLGVPGSDDKLVQQVVKMLLERIYEPVFSDYSHGFRPGRSCHTALSHLRETWAGTKWIVDMDISGFYDNIDHGRLVEILRRKIDDERFIALIEKFLKAGYLEDWKFNETFSGTPQGGICSPILANIFLNELDTFVKDLRASFDKGKLRKENVEYRKLQQHVLRRKQKIHFAEKHGGMLPGFLDELKSVVRELDDQRKKLPFYDVNDDGYKRLKYIRYADDFAISVVGSKADAEAIMGKVKEFLKNDLHLDVSEEKSGIHHIKDGFNFLGYHVRGQRQQIRTVKTRCGFREDGSSYYGVKRTLTYSIGLEVPKEKIWAYCRDKGYLRLNNTPCKKPTLLHLNEYEIVSTYNAEMRGFANYYALAPAARLFLLEWAGSNSLTHTLACKYKTTCKQVRASLKRGEEHMLAYERGGKTCYLKLFKIKHRVKRVFGDPDLKPKTGIFTQQKYDLLKRLDKQACEYCGKADSSLEVHHIRRLKDLQKKVNKAPWEIRMCQLRRKTMVLCRECHDQLHHGGLPSWQRDIHAEMESRVRGNVQARFGGGHTSSPSDLDAWVENKPISD